MSPHDLPKGPVDDYLMAAAESAPEATGAAVLRWLRARPEAVMAALCAVKVAAWFYDWDDEWMLYPVPSAHRSSWLAWVRTEGGQWYWSAAIERGVTAAAESREAAFEAVARTFAEWKIVQPPAEALSMAAPPEPEDDGHAWTGADPEVCTNMGCRRWRSGGRYVFAGNSDEALQRFANGGGDELPGACAGTIPEAQRCTTCKGCGLVRVHWDAPVEQCPYCRGTGRRT